MRKKFIKNITFCILNIVGIALACFIWIINDKSLVETIQDTLIRFER